MIEVLVKEYADGKRRIAYEETREENSDEEYLIERLHENGFKNVGGFTLYRIYDFGVYISYWSNGIKKYKEDVRYLSSFDVALLCKKIKGV